LFEVRRVFAGEAVVPPMSPDKTPLVRTYEFSGSFRADAETAQAVKDIIETILNAVLKVEVERVG